MNKFNNNLDLSFKEFKNQSSCCVCGYWENTSCLHFHHLNPAHKVAEISKFISDKESLTADRSHKICVGLLEMSEMDEIDRGGDGLQF